MGRPGRICGGAVEGRVEASWEGRSRGRVDGRRSAIEYAKSYDDMDVVPLAREEDDVENDRNAPES
jgi:hypothetical protein